MFFSSTRWSLAPRLALSLGLLLATIAAKAATFPAWAVYSQTIGGLAYVGGARTTTGTANSVCSDAGAWFIANAGGGHYTAYVVAGLTVIDNRGTVQCDISITEGRNDIGYNFIGPVHIGFGLEPICNSHELVVNGMCEQPAKPEIESCQVGLYAGNPILPATGEKIKDESDYVDVNAHSLSLVRHYRGNRSAAGALSQTWSHDYANRLQVLTSDANITFGDGRVRTFTNPNGVIAATGSNSVAVKTYPLNPWPSATGQGALIPQSSTRGAPYTGWYYTNPADDSVWAFDGAGKVLSQSQRNGWVMSYTYNSAGQLERVTNTFGRSLVFAYNSGSQLTSINTPDSRIISYGYDNAARLASVSYPGGASKSYLYENASFPRALTGIVDETGQRTTYNYDNQGRAISTALAGGVDRYQVSYGQANQSVVTDPLGTQRSYSYASQNGKLAVTAANLPSGTSQPDTATRVQDASGLVTQETDFLGVQTVYTWDTARRLPLQTTQAAGKPEAQTTNTQWHPIFRLPVQVTEAGKTTAYTYDALGNKLSQTETDTTSGPSNGQIRAWSWTYNALSLIDTATDPMGRITRSAYDTQGNRISVKNALNQETRYAFDAAGRPTQETASNGLFTGYSYDLRGRLLQAISGGETSTFTYQSTGQLATASLPSGLQASYTYDAAQRLIGVADNRGNTITYTLDAMGNRLREEVKDATGTLALVTARVINSLNRVASMQGAAGQTTAMGFDANAEVISQADPLNQTTRQTLDALRRPTSTTLADNTSAQQSFNALDQVTQVTDPKGVATSYQRNAWGEVIVEASPDTGTITYQRNANGEVTGMSDAVGNTTTITRDALGRSLQIQYAPNQVASFSYDSNQAGYLSAMVDKSGSTLYERDAQGRIIIKTQTVNDSPSAPGQFKVSYGRANGELSSINYPSGLNVLYRRIAGRITGIDVKAPSKVQHPFVSNLAYSALGQPKSWSWSNGDAASRSFDADGRMSSNEFANYQFDAASRITGISQRLWVQRTGETVNNAPSQAQTLSQTLLAWQAAYDNRNRLVRFTRDGTSASYSYDDNSNRLSAVNTITSDSDRDGVLDDDDFTQTSGLALKVDAASNRLLGFTQTLTKTQAGKPARTVTSPVNYTLDANGAMTSDGMRSFEYDAARRLAKVRMLMDGEEVSVQYLINALGQRVFKSEPAGPYHEPREDELGTDYVAWLKKNFPSLFSWEESRSRLGTTYVYGDGELGEHTLLGEYGNGSAKGKGRTEYIWLPVEGGASIPVGLYRNGRFYAMHSDHLGTPRLITDQSNEVVWQWAYSAFGDNAPTGVMRMTAPPKAASNNQPTLKATEPKLEVNLRMPGQYFDEESGLFYNYFRSYQATQGRYTQGDPIGLAGGLNRYAYANGAPTMFTDPLGLVTQAEINAAVQTLRSTYPNDFPKPPSSVSPLNMGENGLGMTDWANNIRLNSSRFGDSSTCVKSGDEYQFLQTLAHEMLHVNENIPRRLLSNSFRMGNPLGYYHRQLDDKADAMTTQKVIDQYIKTRNSNKDCTCR